MSSEKTANLQLHRWAGTDNVQRVEFNENWDKIDAEMTKTATTTDAGRMSAADKEKLDGIPATAEENQYAYATVVTANMSGVVKTGGTITAGTKSDTIRLRESADVTLTPNAGTREITVSVNATTAGGTEASKLAKTNANGRVGDAERVGGQTLVNLDTRYAASGHSHTAATQADAGFMSAADKKKLDEVQAGAEVNQNAFSSVSVQDASGVQVGAFDADSKTDTLTLKAGANVALAADPATDTVTINVTGLTAATVSIADANDNFTATNVEGALEELFTSVGSGKSQVAAAITGKGGTVAGTAPHSFQELTDGVNSIHVGDYSIGDTLPVSAFGKTVLIDKAFETSGGLIKVVNDDSFRTCDLDIATGGLMSGYNGSGDLLWNTTATNVQDFDVDTGTGVAYSISTDPSFYRYGATGGRTLKSTTPFYNPYTLRYYGGFLYGGSTDTYVVKYEITPTETLNRLWAVQSSNGSVLDSGIVSDVEPDTDGSVYYVVNTTLIRKRDTNGVHKWAVAGPGSSGNLHRVLLDRINGSLYVLGGSGLRKLDKDTGASVWTVTLPSTDHQFVGTDLDGSIFVISLTKGLSKYNPNGSLIWLDPSIRVKQDARSKRSVVGSNLYVTNDTGQNGALTRSLLYRFVQTLKIVN